MSKQEKNKNYRFKSGTRALMNVKKEMNSTSLILPSATFKNILKNILEYIYRSEGNQDKNIPRFQKIYLETFQSFVESKIIDIISKSLKVCIHDGGRITIKENDILLVLDLLNHPYSDVKYVDVDIVPENPIRKLSYRAGSKRISHGAINILKNVLINMCKEILEKSITYMDHKRNKTLQLQDVKDSVELIYNEHIY